MHLFPIAPIAPLTGTVIRNARVLVNRTGVATGSRQSQRRERRRAVMRRREGADTLPITGEIVPSVSVATRQQRQGSGRAAHRFDFA